MNLIKTFIYMQIIHLDLALIQQLSTLGHIETTLNFKEIITCILILVHPTLLDLTSALLIY